MDTSRYRITGMPDSMFYIANFITEAEEQAILDKIPVNRWTSLAHRRLQAIPTQLTANNTLLASALPTWLSNPVIPRIEALGFFKGSQHGINHCLINEYLPGQGIMPHEDGAAYYPVVATVSLGSTIVLDVTTKSAGNNQADRAVDKLSMPGEDHHEPNLQSNSDCTAWRILQEPRSLLVTTDPAYSDTLHGIAGVLEDVDLTPQSLANWSLLGESKAIVSGGGHLRRQKRISLTFRDVNRVSKIGNRLLGKPRT